MLSRLAPAVALAVCACTSEREPPRASASAAPPVVSDASAPPAARDAKLTNASAVHAQIARAGPGGVVSLYAKLDLKAAPATDDARKEALVAAGVGPQTVSGDIATLRMPVDKLDALLAIPWVTSVETAGFAAPRRPGDGGP